jgi:hypothetical protein
MGRHSRVGKGSFPATAAGEDYPETVAEALTRDR